MTTKQVNYTAEQTAALVEAYKAEPTKATVEAFAVKFGKTAKSVVAKLSREGVYKKAEYVGKTGEKPVKKDTVADEIGAALGLTEAETESLAKANKSALAKIANALKAGVVNDGAALEKIAEEMKAS